MTKTVSKQGRERWQNDKFGMFIHWGLYSLIGRGEWVMHVERIPVAEYETLAPQFNPTKFNADEWVSIAADAGQRYMVITSRHHDGFSMYDTALSDYKITNTPFKRDPIAELADACARRRDLRLGFYSSLLDWHHPAYRFREESGLAWSDYLEFLHGQVRELCTQFGDLACLWFDGDWPRYAINESNRYFVAGGSFDYDALYDMIHTLQPDAMILNNRHEEPLPGEDAQGFEQDLPGSNSVGFNTTDIYDLPLEVGMTINENWGVHTADHNHKTARHLIHTLVRSASAGANYLLNVGPTPEGEILPVHALRLRQMGAWLRLNGDSIYGSRAGTLPPTSEWVSTQVGDTHYVHVLHDVSDWITIPNAPESITKARLLANGQPLDVIRRGTAIKIPVPLEARDPFDTVIALE